MNKWGKYCKRLKYRVAGVCLLFMYPLPVLDMVSDHGDSRVLERQYLKKSFSEAYRIVVNTLCKTNI